MAEKVAGNLGELIALLGPRVADNRVLWFRGQQSAAWQIQPSLWRDYTPEDERNFTNRFRARAAARHQALPRYDDHAMWLSRMQHYGLPTRLLDWTRSPLVAVYFAVQNYIYGPPPKTEDAAVWILEPHTLNEDEGFKPITPSIEAIMCEKMLRPAFTDNDAAETGKVLCAMAAEKDIRMFVQQGCFTIHSDTKGLNRREGSNRYLDRVIIPAERVKQVAFEIDLSGFRRGDLFPDLGNLADELKSRRVPNLR